MGYPDAGSIFCGGGGRVILYSRKSPYFIMACAVAKLKATGFKASPYFIGL
jgi:hypothetical protein